MYRHEEFDHYPAYRSVSAIYRQFLETESMEEPYEYDARKAAYQKTLQHVETVFGEQSEQCAAAHYYLANFYQSDSDIHEAVIHWEKVLAIEKGIFGVLSEDYCNTLNNLGIALADNDQLTLGEGFLRLSLAISVHKNYDEKGHAEFQLARSLEENYKTGRLVAWFKKITAIAPSNELKGMAYHSLAELYKNICGDFQSADNSFRLAIEYLKKGTDNEELSNALFNYGSFLFYRDRPDEAETYLQDVLLLQSELSVEVSEETIDEWIMIYKLLFKIALKKANDDQIWNWSKKWLELAGPDQSTSLDMDDEMKEINNILKEHGNIDTRYHILKKIARDYPCVQAKLLLAYCARDIEANDEAKAILMEISPEVLNSSDRKELFFMLLDEGNFVEAEKLQTGIDDPQLPFLLKTAMLENERTLCDEDIQSLVQSSLMEFHGFSVEDDEQEFMKHTWEQVFQDFGIRLEKCGWINELPLSEQDALKQRLKRGEYEPDYPSKHNIFNIFQRLAVVSFDVECIIGPGDGYRQIFEKLAAASWGNLAFEEYQEKWNEAEETIDLSFKFNDKKFESLIPIEDDWFQEEAIVLINKALKEFKIEQQFISLPAAEQIAYYTFISEKTYLKALEQGIIPTEEQVMEFEI